MTRHSAKVNVNVTNTLKPSGGVPVEFCYWNYATPTDLDSYLWDDKSDLIERIQVWLERLSFETFPFLRIVKAVIEGKGNVPFGHDSGRLEPLRTRKDLEYLLGDIGKIFPLPKRFKDLRCEIENSDIQVHWIHIYRIKNKKVLDPVALWYRDNTAWDLYEWDGIATSESDPVASKPNYIRGSEGKFFQLKRNSEYFVVPLPYALTADAAQLLKALLEMSLNAAGDCSAQMAPFHLSSVESDLRNRDCNELRIRERRKGKSGGYVEYSVWNVPLFNPFHIALCMAKLLKDRQQWIVTTDIRRGSMDLDKEESLIRYRGLHAYMLMQLAEANNAKPKLHMDLLKKDCQHDYHSCREASDRIVASLEYLMNSSLVLQLEDTTGTTGAMDTDGVYWTSLFASLAPCLETDPRGCWVYELRKRSQGEISSPIVEWMDATTSSELPVRTSTTTFWDVRPYIQHGVLSVADSLFKLFLYSKVHSKGTGASISEWSKSVEEAATNFQSNLPKAARVLQYSETLVTVLKFAVAMHGAAESEFGLTEARYALEVTSTLGKKVFAESLDDWPFFKKVLVFKMGADFIKAPEKAWQAYQLAGQGDDLASAGASLVAVSATMGIAVTIVTGAAPTGPVGWLIGALAIIGEITIISFQRHDYEFYFDNSSYTKDKEYESVVRPLFDVDESQAGYLSWYEGTADSHRRQLSTLLGIAFTVDKLDYERVMLGFLVEIKLKSSPIGSRIRLVLDFERSRGKNCSIDFWIDPVDTGGRLRHRIDPDADVFAPKLGACFLSCKSDDGWTIQLNATVIDWNDCDFEELYLKIYPAGTSEFSTPPGKRMRRGDALILSDYAEREL